MRRSVSMRSIAIIVVLVSSMAAHAGPTRDQQIELRVNKLLAQMTLEEKIGQLNQYNFDYKNIDSEIATGRVGSVLNATGTEQVNQQQRIAVEKSRLHIPILFGYDVIHGYKTIFPIPLAMASSFDPALIERMARVSAREASAAGVRWTFSPMVDIARDPRWGRIAEGAGEDTYLGSQIATAYVRGYQGKSLSDPTSIAACAKHFVGYGAAEAGRDYNSVDMSERKLREVYLPPFKAAVDAGVVTFMSSFNTLNGVPASANPFTLRQVLKGEWGFRGFVVSDWNSIGELIPHGVASNKAEAAQQAFTAGVDMDMTTDAYIGNLAELIRTKKIPQSLLDDAVRRILRVKISLGLFEHPYADAGVESATLFSPANVAVAREVAQKSIVLLKNDGQVLPFAKSVPSIAVIGPLADSKADMLGNWFGKGDASNAVTVLEGVRSTVGKSSRILYSKGGEVTRTTEAEIAEAVEVAKQASVTLLVLGEKGEMSGEASSRAELGLPGDQQKLLEAVMGTGKPVALIVMSGRPLTLPWAAEHVPAIMEAWFLGSQAGNAVADVVFGDVNPSGKLPVTFPRSVGQVPLYYNSLNTGRPVGVDSDKKYFSGYLDSPNTPTFPFGYGLSYTKFSYSNFQVASPDSEGNVKATVEVKNIGGRSGDEVVQVYVRGMVGSVSRPVKELKAFQRVSLAAGETRTLEFTIARNQLAFWNSEMHYTVEPGSYALSVGPSSETVLQSSFVINDAGSQLAKRRSVPSAAKSGVQSKRPMSADTNLPGGFKPAN